VTAAEILAAPLDVLMAEAAAVRDRLFGSRVTYSPKVFIPFTRLCRDRCGYCTFARSPAAVDTAYLGEDEVLAIARAGAEHGCTEALFTLGERPEDRYPAARRWLEDAGYASTVDALAAACGLVLAETGLLPHANAGALGTEDLRRLRRVTASQGMMLESLAPDLECHRGCPDKAPGRRLATLEAAGRLAIPFTTGLLVGIGDSRADRLRALEAVADSARRHGHVQEVIIQNFRPKPATGMRHAARCPDDEHLWTLAVARLVLPPTVHLQAPPNLSEDFGRLLDAGIDDWGGISPVTADHVNPERPWPAIERLRRVTEAAGFELAPRLAVYPEYADRAGWLDPGVRSHVLRASDAEGLARDDGWTAGAERPPPELLPPFAVERLSPTPSPTPSPVPDTRAASAVADVLAGIATGEAAGLDELVTLFSARGREVAAVADAADALRRAAVGDTVTWVANRNINYTNVCTFRCRFCAFSKGPLSLNLRGAPYLLGIDEIQYRVTEAVERGATEVCLQGGIHPSFDGDYYVEVCRAVKDVAPRIHVHGFTALEVTEGARRLGEPLARYLGRLKAAGLASLPGTAAEILDDEVRAVLCPDKVDTEEWLEAHRTAHRVGLRSNITIMFGSVERPRHWARHLVRTRALQHETGGFTEFVPLPFVHMAAPLYLEGRARRGPTFREVLLMHAVGRIAYAGAVPNVQASWVKLGVAGARQVLRAGANDLGGTLMDENISRAAGATHGQAMDAAAFAGVVAPLGRPLEQRTTLYGPVLPSSSLGRFAPSARTNQSSSGRPAKPATLRRSPAGRHP